VVAILNFAFQNGAGQYPHQTGIVKVLLVMAAITQGEPSPERESANWTIFLLCGAKPRPVENRRITVIVGWSL